MLRKPISLDIRSSNFLPFFMVIWIHWLNFGIFCKVLEFFLQIIQLLKSLPGFITFCGINWAKICYFKLFFALGLTYPQNFLAQFKKPRSLLNKCFFCSFLSFLGTFLLIFSLMRSIPISIFTSFSLFLLLRFSRVYRIEITEKIITRQNKNKKKRSQMRELLSLKRFTKTN